MDQILETRTKSSPWGVVVWGMAAALFLYSSSCCARTDGCQAKHTHPCPCLPCDNRSVIDHPWLPLPFLVSVFPFASFGPANAEAPPRFGCTGLRSLWSFLGVACRVILIFYEGVRAGEKEKQGREGKASRSVPPAGCRAPLCS